MIPGLISQELHKQLLDPKNYQNRTSGVEELKRILSEADVQSVPSDSIEDFIGFLPRLLDDSNFKVLCGTLQVLNLLIQKLDTSVGKYLKQLVLVALKALGDARTITRNEYMNVFGQLMKTVAPQQVLDLVISNLKHKNSRVREDVLNIIMAAMLTHPRRDFNIPKLCFEVAPHLADSKRKVRHAALELFAVLDYCLDTGKKQPLMKAVDMVELNEDAEGLMAAVQARRARHVLPRLSSEGVVEYGLAVPKPGQRCSVQYGSGADLDWVMNGGRISSARSHRTEPDCDRLYGYGSLGSLTDDLPLQRRIVSAGKGKNKLPWEMSSFSSTENEQQCGTPNGKCSEQGASEDFLPLSRKLSPETYIPSFSSADPQKKQSSRRRESPAHLRRSGSLNLDPDIFKTTNFSDPDVVASKGRTLQRNPSVERTFSLPSNPTTPGSFLLPSYPLPTLPGGMLTPTMSRRHGDPSLSMSNTWPNKRESSLHQRDTSPWRDTAKGDHLSSISSPRPLRASLVTSSSTSSFRRALSSTRATTLSISPVVPPLEQAQSHKGQRPHAPGSPQNQQLEKSLHLDPDGFRAVQDPQEDDPLDMQEMMNSLRSLRNSAAKKRAKVSLSSPDPDSPDSAVRLDMDSQSQTSPKITSSASESGLSSLSSVANSSSNGIKTSPGNSASSGMKPHIARVPSAKLRSSVSMDFSSLQGIKEMRSFFPHSVALVSNFLTSLFFVSSRVIPEKRTRAISNISFHAHLCRFVCCSQMMNSLRSLRNSAAKKRAKVSLSSPDPDSPDSAVRLDMDSQSQTSPKITSSASESGLSSLSSVANSSSNGIKTSPGNSASSGMKPHIARVPSAKLRSSVSMDFSSLQGLSQRNELSSEVGVVGQRVTYSNGTIKTEMETTGTSPPLVKLDLRETVRGLKPAKGQPAVHRVTAAETHKAQTCLKESLGEASLALQCLAAPESSYH
ncbi:putative protein FAM179B-like [Scophthalmus maximus]|uniref:TOG domain-containing protein n=1 Tax=Scophthalmus maximus TaxID=52904 RepID=A0A2U9CJC4_SCOMX|nr:putative protein FAM179B-like [Scophthalmus maximus]